VNKSGTKRRKLIFSNVGICTMVVSEHLPESLPPALVDKNNSSSLARPPPERLMIAKISRHLSVGDPEYDSIDLSYGSGWSAGILNMWESEEARKIGREISETGG